MPYYHRDLQSAAAAAATPNNSSVIPGLFDESSQQQRQPSLYSHNDRPTSFFDDRQDAISQYGNNSSYPRQFDQNTFKNRNYSEEDDAQRTITMTVFFLVFMIIYIGFCFWYQKKKVRSRVMDEDENGEGGLSRRQQLRQNQVSPQK